jgi:hypothetical protein
MASDQKQSWYSVSKTGVQFLRPESDFIGWENIEMVEIVDDIAVKHPKSTFSIGLLLITSVLILIPIQRFDLLIIGDGFGGSETILLLVFYLLMMGFGLWFIRNALVKRPVLKIHFKKGGYEMIVLGKHFGNDDSQDIIASLTKHLGAKRVVFAKELA